jgi:maltooligosyltrehalose synthase
LSGPNAKHGVAFLRIHQGEVALAFAPRLVAGLTGAREVAPVSGVWKGTYLILADGLPTGSWQNILTREQLSPERHEGQWALGLEKMLGSFPVALLSLRQ